MNHVPTFDKFLPVSGIIAVLFAFQAIGAIIALRRLTRWRHLPPPLEPAPTPGGGAGVTIVIPTLNEAARLGGLLDAISGQSAAAILFVDSRSADGSREMIEAAAARDPRIRLITDDPLPDGWIGKAWALECARVHVRTEWILVLDADTVPRAGLVETVVAAAVDGNYDAISLAPRFAGQSAGERWLQPSILVSLLYRFGPYAGEEPGRVLANGQCMLTKRELLEAAGGYAPVRASFAEDVSLITHLAHCGARVAFLDGAHLYDVRSYSSARQMWREWGRSVDLKDATTTTEQIVDTASIIAVQGMPLLVLAVALAGTVAWTSPLVTLSAILYAVRWTLLAALRHSYAARGLPYWLSPLSDPVAALRIVISSMRRPTSWRGRSYPQAARP